MAGAQETAEVKVMVNFSGTWKLEKSENFDELLKAMGVGFIARKAITGLKPEFTITQDENNFHIISKNRLQSRESRFKVGEEFREKHPLKDDVNRLLVTWEGDTLVQTPLDEGTKERADKMTRSLEDGKMIIRTYKGDIVATRTFVKS
ncbi:fatty acid-binding protein, brain-like [Amphiura filiformis]|uniref:fatty acid-binding protein, brain-like n=1 Tax=Amphiura filiformis TaxID=82378 RepID=UPI003B20D45C